MASKTKLRWRQQLGAQNTKQEDIAVFVGFPLKPPTKGCQLKKKKKTGQT